RAESTPQAAPLGERESPEEAKDGVGEAKPHPGKERSRERAQGHVHLEPVKRGGRPRVTSVGASDNKRSRSSRPDLVCWKREREWVLGLEVSSDSPNSVILEVAQDGFPLAQDQQRDGCWLLENVAAKVSVEREDEQGPEEFSVAADSTGILLFKLSVMDLR